MPRTHRRALLAGAALASAGTFASPARRGRAQGSLGAPEVLARFPNGTFLENLLLDASGRVLFTNYTGRRIEAWSPGAGHATLADVADAHPVALAPLGEGYALTAHGAAFTEGPAAMRGTNAVLLLDARGAATGRVAVPGAVFLNGLLALPGGALLAADSALGRIWVVHPAAGSAEAWLDHADLAPDPARPGLPGANGVKLSPDRSALLVSNSAARSLLRVPLRGGRALGAPERVAAFPGGVDDFAVRADGTVFAATHGVGLARLAPRAREAEALDAPGLEGSTALALSPDGRTLYALGTGGLSAGGRGEALLARLAVG